MAITVTPAKTWSAPEVVTTAKLNATATPIVTDIQPTSISALRLVSIASLSTGDQVHVADGTGMPRHKLSKGQPAGTYVDNGFSVIVPTGGDGSAAWLWDWSGEINGLWAGLDPTGVTAINTQFNKITALLAANGGGTIYLPAGRYKTTATLYIPSGVNLRGDGYLQSSPTATREGTTSIYGVHTGAAIISLKGASGCKLSNFSVEGDQTNHPKTGLSLGRSSAASAGFHNISRLGVFGYFSQAAIYSIASEVNTIDDVFVWLFGGGAKYCFYTSTTDTLAVDSMTTSTNLAATIRGMTLINSVNDANSACVYMDVGVSMGSWNFCSCYLTAYSGSYVQINIGSLDGSSEPLGPFTFVGVSGERLAGGDPLYGYRLTASTAVSLPGLNIIGSRFDLLADTSHYTISQDSNLTLISPHIVLQPAEAFPYALDSIIRSQILGGIVSTGRSARWTDATLAGSWTNTYGSPYPQAGYSIDCNGIISLRGVVQGGSGTILTLPAGYRPAVNMFFPTYAGGVLGRILVTASTGVVSFASGTNTEVDLSTVKFNSI